MKKVDASTTHPGERFILISPNKDDPMPLPRITSVGFRTVSVSGGLKMEFFSDVDYSAVEAWALRAVERKEIILVKREGSDGRKP